MIHNRDSEPCTAAGGAKEQSGEPAPRDQELHIVGHRNRMEPIPRTVQVGAANLRAQTENRPPPNGGLILSSTFDHICTEDARVVVERFESRAGAGGIAWPI
jgi:hypothetical protein